MMDKKEVALESFEGLLAQLEFIPESRLPAIGSSDLLLKSLDQGYVVLAESVFKQVRLASEDMYIFGHYCSRMELGDSLFVTSIKRRTSQKEREIGRLIYNRTVDIREVRNAGKRNKCLLLKDPSGYDALCGTGTTIRPARVMLSKDDAITELIKRYSAGSKVSDGSEEEPDGSRNRGFMGFFRKEQEAPKKTEIISLEEDY